MVHQEAGIEIRSVAMLPVSLLSRRTRQKFCSSRTGHASASPMLGVLMEERSTRWVPGVTPCSMDVHGPASTKSLLMVHVDASIAESTTKFARPARSGMP